MALESPENPLGQLPNPYGPGDVIFNQANTGTEQLKFNHWIHPGTYLIKAASGGAAYSGAAGYWVNYRTSGGSGGAWEGQVRFDSIVAVIADVNPQGTNGGDMAVYVNGTRLFYISGGVKGNAAAATGGVLTKDAALDTYVANAGNQVSVQANGNAGTEYSAAWGTPGAAVNNSPSTVTTGMAQGTWGMGGGTSVGPNPGGFFIQRIS